MSIVAETATIAHGYSMADVDRFARRATVLYGRGQAMDYQDRHDAAWHAIVEHLYAGGNVPDERELINVGCYAIQSEFSAYRHHHGISYVKDYATGANFIKYWSTRNSEGDDFTDRMIERLALPQVLAHLTPKEYEAIAALAALGSHKEGAAALGIGRDTFGLRIKSARTRILELWLAPEHPRPRLHGDPDYCPHGHRREGNTFINTKGTKMCTICKRNTDRRQRLRGKDT